MPTTTNFVGDVVAGEVWKPSEKLVVRKLSVLRPKAESPLPNIKKNILKQISKNKHIFLIM
jgi:hypothetical protein